ncbi:MAG TPA: ABC transporter ATP-binding protein [Burkholderiaceae bacterium]|nr:ABC transporter ATP-binding protein [Burkholderiaceae bacterium]
MSGVTLNRVCKRYADVLAVDDVSIDIRDGELLALLGPSGCGKTTTLRMIAGFIAPTSGRIAFGERDVTDVPVHKRNVGMVFQGYALFPHLSVAKNIEFGLRVRAWDAGRKARRVAEMLRWVQLDAMADRQPRALSGGQQQRVALARAMAIEPDVLLLDEPFSALDAKLRTQMRKEIRDLQRDAGITSLFVTHDQEEAMAIADRIGVMNQGRLEQLGSAEDLYERPVSRFVAGFIGKCNFIEGRVTADRRFESAAGRAFAFPGDRPAGTATLCLRPEHAVLLPGGAGESASPAATGDPSPELVNRIAVTVRSVTYLGASTEVETVTDDGELLIVSAAPDGARAGGSSGRGGVAAPGQRMTLGWRADGCFVVD